MIKRAWFENTRTKIIIEIEMENDMPVVVRTIHGPNQDWLPLTGEEVGRTETDDDPNFNTSPRC